MFQKPINHRDVELTKAMCGVVLNHPHNDALVESNGSNLLKASQGGKKNVNKSKL